MREIWNILDRRKRRNLFQAIENRFLSLEDSSTRRLREFLLLRCVRVTKKRLYAISTYYAGQGHVNVFLEAVSTTLVTNNADGECQMEWKRRGKKRRRVN